MSLNSGNVVPMNLTVKPSGGTFRQVGDLRHPGLRRLGPTGRWLGIAGCVTHQDPPHTLPGACCRMNTAGAGIVIRAADRLCLHPYRGHSRGVDKVPNQRPSLQGILRCPLTAVVAVAKGTTTQARGEPSCPPSTS